MLAQLVQLERRMLLMMTHLPTTRNAMQSSAPLTNEW
jgi:hypothetical protein